MTPFTKSLSLVIAGVMVGLFLLTTFVPYPPARVEAEPYFTAEEIDAGLQYTFERRCLFWASTAVQMTLLCSFALTSQARFWGDRFLRWTGGNRVLAALGLGLAYLLLSEILAIPFVVARFYQAHAWEMSNLDLPGWLREHLLAFALNGFGEAVVFAGLYVLLILLPRSWWLLATLGAGLLGMAYAFLAPTLVAPLFNDFTPLADTPWHALQPRVQALMKKAGVPVQEILVMNASLQSKHTNAYFTGFGNSRCIVLYDNLLKKHTNAEIESILAHELGHWQHDHIVKGILLGMVAALAGLWLLDRLLRLAVGRAPWQLRSPADPAGLPLILLLMSLGEWGMLPLTNAVSRHFERQADQASLDWARQPEAFIAAEQKLARHNIANVAPTPWNVWLFASHPPTVERIHMAEVWREAQK